MNFRSGDLRVTRPASLSDSSAAPSHLGLAPKAASTTWDDEPMPAQDVFRGEPVTEQDSRRTRRPFAVKRFGRTAAAAPEISLLVTTYHKPWHLTRVLQSIALQQGPSGLFEVVVTDDGSTDHTHRIVEEFARSVRFPVTLTTHTHDAFQVARCRNEGALTATAPYLLFLDGDCVLPPDHVLTHLHHRQADAAMCGYCVRLDEATSQRLDTEAIRSAEYTRWVTRPQTKALAKRDRKARWYRLIRHPTKPQLTGGNCGVWRSDFEKVNGFDEHYEGWGGEDTDLGLRLRRVGVKIASILRWTHTYHLWHPPDATAPARIRDGVNHAYFTRGYRFTKCLNGLVARQRQQLTWAVVGEPEQAEQAVTLLNACGFGMPSRSDQAARRPEIEFLFLPGKGTFSGQADCNVLIVLDDCARAKRIAKRAHVVVADANCRQSPSRRPLQLADLRHALDTLLR